MRFDSLTFRRFGLFEDVTLDLSNGREGLHVIHGLNEAGKTTALHGLGFLLFGFPHALSHDFRYLSKDQRIGAKLRDGRGGTLECFRRRGAKKTLLEADDRTAVEEARLRELLGGLTKEQFEMLFGLNHDQLADGGRLIVEGKGGVGEALFAAGAGLAGMRRIDQHLQDRIDQLYKRQGRNQQIAVGLSSLQETREKLRNSILQIETWSAQEEALRQAHDRQEELDAQRKQNREELRRLEAYRSALPAIGAFQDLQTQLEPLKSCRQLGERFAEDHREMRTDLQVALTKREAAGKEMERVEEELRAKGTQDSVLAEEAVIGRLKEQLGACLKAEHDRLGLYARKREHEGNAHTILRRYFARESLKDAESLQLPPAAQERIRDLGGNQHAALQAVNDLQDRLAGLDAEIASKTEALAAAPSPADTTSLDALSRSILQEGPLEKNLREAEDRLAAERKRVEPELNRLTTCWRGHMEGVLSLPAPSLPQVQHYKDRFKQHADKLVERQKRREEHEKTIRERARQIERLIRAGSVPSEIDLAGARADRDSGIDLAGKSLLGGSPDPSVTGTFVARHAPSDNLFEAICRSIRHCDDLADQMRREAKRASELSLYQSEQGGAEQERDQLGREIQSMEQQQTYLKKEWSDEWTASGVTPKSPVEMEAWLQQLTQLRDGINGLRIAAESTEGQRRHVEECKARLHQEMNLDDKESDSLAQLLELARNRIEIAAQQKEARRALENGLRELRRTRQAEERREQEARGELTAWEEEWGQAVSLINLEVSAEPTTAYGYLDQLTKMFQELREAGTIELRVNGMDRDLGQFLNALQALRARLEVPGQPPCGVETMPADMDAFVRRLNDARQLRTEREMLERDLKRAKEKLDEADKGVMKLEAGLQTLRQEAGVASEEDIPSAIQQSDERRHLAKRIEEERAKLHQQARGQALDQFLADALSARETLDTRLAQLQDRVEPLDREIQEQAVAADAARRQLEEWHKASAAAAECKQEQESLLAALREQVSEYTALHMARQILKQATERFRLRHQNSMLSQAEQFFKLLTDGAFNGLEVDENDDGQPVLIALRTTPQERVEMAGLSDGTRDQLFLALRLAGIEQHLQQRQPMPLIVDDVLVNFDDNRARATLACLAQLARRTQVLLFTHHDYLVELAKKSVATDVLFCHSLSPPPLARIP